MDVVDFNHDHYLDIVIPNEATNDVIVFLNLGNGTFVNQQTYNMGNLSGPNFVISGDVNNDHHHDVIVALTQMGSIGVLLGNGNGSFHDALFISAKMELFDTFIVGDLNTDERADIVYTSNSLFCVGVLLGRGDGLFEAVTKYYTPSFYWPCSVSLGYYNNDPFLDIVVSSTSYFYADSSISIYMGMGNGSFIASSKLSSKRDSIPSAVMFADLDNDHQQDIAVVANNQIRSVDIFLVHYDGDFSNEKRYTTGSNPHPISISVGD